MFLLHGQLPSQRLNYTALRQTLTTLTPFSRALNNKDELLRWVVLVFFYASRFT